MDFLKEWEEKLNIKITCSQVGGELGGWGGLGGWAAWVARWVGCFVCLACWWWLRLAGNLAASECCLECYLPYCNIAL